MNVCCLLPVPMSLGNAASRPSTRSRFISTNWRAKRHRPFFVHTDALRTTILDESRKSADRAEPRTPHPVAYHAQGDVCSASAAASTADPRGSRGARGVVWGALRKPTARRRSSRTAGAARLAALEIKAGGAYYHSWDAVPSPRHPSTLEAKGHVRRRRWRRERLCRRRPHLRPGGSLSKVLSRENRVREAACHA